MLPDLTPVQAGSRPDGLTWEILAGGAPGDLSTFVRRRLGAAHATSGFGGPALYPGQLVNTWYGRADGTPFFVLARAAPEVEAVIAVCASGAEFPLELSPVVPEFGLRFGAVPLPDGETLVELRTVPPCPTARVHRLPPAH